MTTLWSGFDDVPELDPVVAHEATDYGWRGLTAKGEIYEVRGRNGHKAIVPSSITVTRGDKVIGRREVTNQYDNIAEYLRHYNYAVEVFRQNQLDQALVSFDAAIQMVPTAAARFNRGLVLLAMGRWHEGFESYEARLELMTPPMCADLKLNRWRGEPTKSLLLVHDAGFGDTIMMLRYVPLLRRVGVDIQLLVPPELERFAEQVAPVTRIAPEVAPEEGYYCPMLSLLYNLGQSIESIPNGSYLSVNRALVEKWRGCINKKKHKIGVAWSVGRKVEGDYPRAMPLADLLAFVADKNVEVHSIQIQDAGEAAQLGVYTHEFEDFADCAALISLMDSVITVDTAAAHIAGAIGHPDVTVVLGSWASWRWHDNPFYPNVKLRHVDHRPL